MYQEKTCNSFMERSNDETPIRQKRTCKTCGGPRTSTYGFPGEKASHCRVCKLPDQVNVYKKTCQCGSGLTHTHKERDGPGRYCSKCKPQDADRWCVVGQKCNCGSGKPKSYGLPNDNAPTACIQCKTQEHTRCFRKYKTCTLCDSGARANYCLKGSGTRIACKKCVLTRNPDDYTLASRPTCSCGSGLYRSHAIGNSWKLVACRACMTPDHWSTSAVRSAKRRAALKETLSSETIEESVIVDG